MKLNSTIRDSIRIEHTAQPEKRLMVAVLQGVVDDHWGSVYRRAAGYGSPTNRRRLRAAVAYVANRDRRWPFSFENLCEALSLDSGRLRRSLLEVPAPGPARVAADNVPKAGGVIPLQHTPQGELADRQRTMS